ncbi:MAG: hypothetical protein SPE93_10560, partial [Candidatus Limivicinus sp.]|nr:hypothetical protein [Candidatus Limivicinus sp.]
MKLSFKTGAASLIKYKASQSFFASEGEKINQIHFCRGRVPRQKYFSRSECRAKRGMNEAQSFCRGSAFRLGATLEKTVYNFLCKVFF